MLLTWDRCGRDRMVVGFTTSAHHHKRCEFKSRQGKMYLIQHYVIKFVAGRWFSPISSTNKTDRREITEILFKVALNTITLTHVINLILLHLSD
jgi:hypothetical protein